MSASFNPLRRKVFSLLASNWTPRSPWQHHPRFIGYLRRGQTLAHSLIVSISCRSSFISKSISRARGCLPSSSASFCSTYRSMSKSWISYPGAFFGSQAIVSFHLNSLPRRASANLKFHVGNTGGSTRVPPLSRVLQKNHFVQIMFYFRVYYMKYYHWYPIFGRPYRVRAAGCRI